MLQFTLDGETQPIPERNFDTFGDFYDVLSEELKKENRVIIKVYVDNQEMEHGKQYTYFEDKLSKFSDIKVETQDRNSVLKDNIEAIDEHIDKMVENIEKASELFRQGDMIESQNYFAAVIEGIRWFNYSLDLIFSFLRVDPAAAKVGDIEIENKINKISEIIATMADTQEKSDWVLLADQLEFELKPEILSWKEVNKNFSVFL